MTHMRWWHRALLTGIAIACFFCAPSIGDAAEGRDYRVQGHVVAVNVTDQPNMIVVKTPVTNRSDMTVGATVTAQTKILRRGKRVGLHTIRVGETVWLTYVKRRDGVVARLIQLGA